MEQIHTIRSAAISDAETVYNFISHLEERTFDLEKFNERFKENISKSGVIYLVAVNDEDDPIGFISGHGQHVLHHEGWVYEIQELYVARNFRNKGIAKSLIRALQERLSKTDCENLEVTTNLNRSDAKRFYSKLGFNNTHLKYVKEF